MCIRDRIEAFKSTLEEARYADIIIHVVDSSSPQMERQMQVVYETLKQLGVEELSLIHILDRKLQEKRVFPAIDIARSGTRREDLLLSSEELEAVSIMRKALNSMKAEEATENLLNMFAHTKSNQEVVSLIRRQKYI